MNATRVLGAVLLAGAALASIPGSSVRAQGATYEVRRGDTLFGVARKAMHDGVTRNQMILAIFRANQNGFLGGNIHRLEVGTVLSIPGRDEVAKIQVTEADRQLRELLAPPPPAAPPPPLAAAKPAPAVIVPARPSATASLPLEDAAKRYREGLGLERRGNDQGALTAFLEAGEAGYGLAQLKLGQIYDKGNAVVPRDYQAALKWYQRAREQGVSLDKPVPRTPRP